jgi:hypothetical protein
MLCGTLPFEDNDLDALYQKIWHAYYAFPVLPAEDEPEVTTEGGTSGAGDDLDRGDEVGDAWNLGGVFGAGDVLTQLRAKHIAQACPVPVFVSAKAQGLVATLLRRSPCARPSIAAMRLHDWCQLQRVEPAEDGDPQVAQERKRREEQDLQQRRARFKKQQRQQQERQERQQEQLLSATVTGLSGPSPQQQQQRLQQRKHKSLSATAPASSGFYQKDVTTPKTSKPAIKPPDVQREVLLERVSSSAAAKGLSLDMLARIKHKMKGRSEKAEKLRQEREKRWQQGARQQQEREAAVREKRTRHKRMVALGLCVYGHDTSGTETSSYGRSSTAGSTTTGTLAWSSTCTDAWSETAGPLLTPPLQQQKRAQIDRRFEYRLQHPKLDFLRVIAESDHRQRHRQQQQQQQLAAGQSGRARRRRGVPLSGGGLSLGR